VFVDFLGVFDASLARSDALGDGEGVCRWFGMGLMIC
jgi:hypothetical protein